MRWYAALILAIIILSYTSPLQAIAQTENGAETPTNTTTNTSAVTNITVNEAPPIYANTIHFSEGDFAVGLCYPWIIFHHNFLDLSTWTTTPGIGGDTAVSVECADNYFIVKGTSGVYVVDRDTGEIKEIVSLKQTLTYIGEVNGILAFLDIPDQTVLVHTPFTGDIHIPLLTTNITDIRFGVYNGVPFIAYIAVENNSKTLMVANPTITKVVATLPQTSNTLLVYRNFIIVEYNGIKTFKVTDTTTLTTIEYTPYTMYLPFDLEKIETGTPNNLLAVTSTGLVVKINLEDKTWKFFGEGTVTPVGIFLYNPDNPEQSTTYININGTWYPVPGYAVAHIGYLALTNIILGTSENETTFIPVLWPIIRTNLVATEPVNGLLQIPTPDGVKVIRLSLTPGVYALPRYSSVLTDRGAIALDRDEVYYPPTFEAPPEVNSSLVNYTVATFPDTFSSLDTFSNVKYVASGAGKLLIITSKEAIVYSEYGVTTIIPGVWMWGGVGDKVVLYDGASFRVYDYAGNPVKAYQAYVSEKPVYVTYDNGEVHLFTKRYHIVISDTGVEKKEITVPSKYDAVYGTSVKLTQQPEVQYGKFTYRIPYADFVSVNKYMVAWSYQQDNTTEWGILDIAKHRVYVLLNAPSGTIYPLGDYIAYYNGTNVMILPFTSWIISKCYVDINAPPDAQIYINSKYVGAGALRYYTKCYESINITAIEPYHKPTSKTVVVKPGGVNVTVIPEPKISNVRLAIVKPDKLPVVGVTLEINGKLVDWNINEVKQVVAGKPYNITVVAFHPFDVCDHEVFANVTFAEGNDTLQIPCKIVGSVLGVTSNVTATIEIRAGGNIYYTSTVGPNAPFFTEIDPGEYEIIAKPLEEGYVERTLNITVPMNELVVVDATPYKYSKLIIQTVPEIADIQVLDTNGTVIGEGTGNLTLELLPGDYQIVATAPGFQQYVETVTLNPGEDKIVNITLVPIPTQPQQVGKPFWQDIRFQILVIAAVAGAVAFALWYRRRKEVAEMGEELVEGGE